MQTRAAVPLRPPAIFHTCNSVTLGLSRRTGQDRSILNFSELPVRGLTHRGASFHCAHTLELYWGIVSQVMDTDKKTSEAWQLPAPGHEGRNSKRSPRVPPLVCTAWQARARMTNTGVLPNRYTPNHSCLT